MIFYHANLLKFQHFFLFSKKLELNISFYSTLTSLNGGADIETANIIFFSQIRANCASGFEEIFLQITFFAIFR